jgi:hypothetical protein
MYVPQNLLVAWQDIWALRRVEFAPGGEESMHVRPNVEGNRRAAPMFANEKPCAGASG